MLTIRQTIPHRAGAHCEWRPILSEDKARKGMNELRRLLQVEWAAQKLMDELCDALPGEGPMWSGLVKIGDKTVYFDGLISALKGEVKDGRNPRNDHQRG